MGACNAAYLGKHLIGENLERIIASELWVVVGGCGVDAKHIAEAFRYKLRDALIRVCSFSSFIADSLCLYPGE